MKSGPSGSEVKEDVGARHGFSFPKLKVKLHIVYMQLRLSAGCLRQVSAIILGRIFSDPGSR